MVITLPDRTTGWKLVAKGITRETLAGEAAMDVVAKKPLFGELKLPMAFTDGDEAELLASIHNDAVDKGTIEVTLRAAIAGRRIEEKKTVEVQGKGIHEVPFHLTLRRPEPGKEGEVPADAAMKVALELIVESKGEKSTSQPDALRRSVPLLPYGVPVFATASGLATSDTTAWVTGPKEFPFRSPRLQILVGPSIQRSLLDIVLGPAPDCQIESSRFASGLETSTSDLMASLALQKLVEGTRDAGGPQAQALDGRVRGAVGMLVASQQDDGGWSWTGRGGKSHRYASVRVFWALSLARTAGYPVPDDAFHKATAYLKGQIPATDNSDYESKAILLHALSTAGQGDFALANRLYRERPALSAAALAHVALALVELDRKSMAGELLALLAERDLDQPALRRLSSQGVLPWSHAVVEIRALYALALQRVTPRAPTAQTQVDWLLGHRTGHRWAPDKATGPAALALAEWFSHNRFQGEHYKLAVFVNDIQVQVLEIDDASATQTIDVPSRLLKGEKQRINFQIAGRGRYAYQCILAGFAPAETIKSSTMDWRVERFHEPAPLEFDGRDIPRGFSVVEGSYSSFRNPLTQLPVGRRGQVELRIWRHNLPPNVPEEQLEYLVVSEPIPSGASVVESSVQGGFERYEIAPARSPSTWAAATSWNRFATRSMAICPAPIAPVRPWSATPTGRSSSQ